MNAYIHEDKDQIIRVIKLIHRNLGDNRAQGYHDRLDSELIHCKKTPEFKKMWYTDIETIEKGDGQSEIENVYVFREEDSLSKIRDHEFWEDFGADEDFPFIFVTFMRISATLSSITTLRKQFEEKLHSFIHTEDAANKLFRDCIRDCKCISYCTTDISDIVLVTRSKSHEIGSALIEALSCLNFQLCQEGDTTRGLKDVLVSCYTISAFSLTHTEGLQEVRRPHFQEILKHDKEDPSPMNSLSNHVVYSGQALTTGTHNDTYRVLAAWIASQFSEGILCCPYILTDRGPCPSLGPSQTPDNDPEIIKETWHWIRSQLRSRLRVLNESKLEYDIEHGYSMVAYKSVLQTLNYIEKYGSADFPQYGYMIILDAFLGIVDNMLNYDNASDKNRAYANETKLLTLLININSVLQNSNRAERYSFASPEINSAIADMPPKLISMHASFLQKLQTLLKNVGKKIDDLDKTDSSRREYSVLYYPSVTSPESEEITYGNEKAEIHRLNIVRTNAQFAMDIKNLWLISSHEMAHAIGRELKNRHLRHDSVISLCLHAFFDCEIRLITERFHSSVSSHLEISPSEHNALVSESVKYYIEKVKEDLRTKHQLNAKKNNHYYKNIAKNDIYASLDEILFPIRPVANGFDWLYTLLCDQESAIRPTGITVKEFKIKLAAAIKAEENAYEMRLLKIQLHNVYKDNVKAYHDKDHVTLPNLVHQSFDFIDEVYADVIELLVTEASPQRYFDSLASQYAAMGNYKYDEAKKSYGLLGVNLDQLRVLCTVGAIIASEDKIENDYGIPIFSKNWKNEFTNMRKATVSDSSNASHNSNLPSPDTRTLKYDLCNVFIDIKWEEYFNPSEAINLPNYGEYIFQSPFIVDIVVHFIYHVILHFSQKTCLKLFDKISRDHENNIRKGKIRESVKEAEREKVRENEDLLRTIREIYSACAHMESLDDFADAMYRLNDDLYHTNIKIIHDFYDKSIAKGKG
ncbi:MAG: hypothetical protein FWG14_12860 [Peptococcaceae bacterium]|nr:hypothetical protein [Peptococcaceae bacterium]